MNALLIEILNASDGLLFTSETDQPFLPVHLQTNDLIPVLQELTASENWEEVSLDHFFRNAIRSYPQDRPEQKLVAERFLHLKNLLANRLPDLRVLRFGRIQVDAFLIGQIQTNEYIGLRTKLVET